MESGNVKGRFMIMAQQITNYDRRLGGEAIYPNGTPMKVSDLVRVEPTTMPYKGPKWAVGQDGDIQGFAEDHVVLKMRDERRELRAHPADLTLLFRYDED